MRYLAALLGCLISTAALAQAQPSFPSVAPLTGSEIVKDESDPTGGYFTTGDIANFVGSGHNVPSGWCDLVKDGGAPTNGTSDSLPAFNKCLGTGLPIWVPGGTSTHPAVYMLSGTIVIPSDTTIQCPAPGLVTIQLMAGVNANVIMTTNANHLVGTNSPTGMVVGTDISGCRFDGNVAHQTGTATAENGIEIYGFLTHIHNSIFQHVAGSCMVTDAYQFAGGSTVQYISSFEFIVTDTCGLHGWDDDGPSDSNIINYIAIDSGQAADDTYYGLYLHGQGTARVFNFHGYHRSTATNRVAYQGYFTGNAAAQITNSHFEGGRQEFYADNATTCGGCQIYAPFGSASQALATVGAFYPFSSTTIFTCTGGAGNNPPAIYNTQRSQSSPCPGTEGVNAVDLQTQRYFSSQVAAGVGSALVGGLGNLAQGQASAVVGGNQNFLVANDSGAVGGNFGTDRGLSSQVLSAGKFNIGGDAQGRGIPLHCQTTTTSGCVLQDGETLNSGTEILIPPNTRYTMRILVNCIDNTTPANGYSWALPIGKLLQGSSAASTTWAAGTAVTLTDGTVTGAGVAVAADTSNGGMIITFTPPTGNTDTWDCVGIVNDAESQ